MAGLTRTAGPLRAAVALVAMAAVSLTAGDARAASTAAPMRTDEIAPGVFAVISLDPLGLANHSNAVFIVSGEDVILVDTQFTLARTREVLRIVRGKTDAPIGVLINTHWHDDHTFANQVITEAAPGVEIIAHAATKRDMAGIGVANRGQQVAGGADALAMFRSCIEKKTSMDGSPMSVEEESAYESTITIARQYLDEQPDFHLTLPTRTFTDPLVLKRGNRSIEVRHLGPAVTEGDAVVWLPGERVLIAGDIVDNPFPFAYRCNVSGWIAALDSIKALNPRLIVPGHGEALQGTAHVERLAALLRSIRDQTRSAAGRGETLEQARAGIDVKDARAALAGTDKMLAFLFDDFFVGAVVQSAFEEVPGK